MNLIIEKKMDEGLQLRLDALREHVRHAWMANKMTWHLNI